jgi:hypothetical protein
MSESEDFCGYNGQSNNGDDEWLIDSINDSNELNEEHEIPKKEESFHKMVFKNLQETKDYTMKNPGHTFIRNPDGPGFIIKGTIDALRFSKKHEEDLNRQMNIKQGNPARSHFPWRDQEIASLLKFYNSNKQINDIAIELERSPIAISAKLRNLGLITEEEHQKTLNMDK